MNIILPLNEYNNKNVFFLESVKNNVVELSNFIRIIYSNAHFMLNSLIFEVDINIFHVEKYFNKYKYLFNFQLEKNMVFINTITKIEKDLLGMLHNSSLISKKPVYKIQEQLSSGYIKIHNEDIGMGIYKNKNIYIKISGIWESDIEYGIIFKFLAQ
jgi:hypothetical protein